MATALQGFRITAKSCTCQPATRHYVTRPIGPRRLFSSSALKCEEKKDDIPLALQAALNKAAKAPDAARGKYIEQGVMNQQRRLDRFMESSTNSMRNRSRPPRFPFELRPLEKPAKTFLNLGETEAIDGFPESDESDDPDITILGHGELEHHREMRHYARLAAWEMPMLSTLAKPFEPPTADMPLMFRYTTYMGDHHPAEKKVVVEFCTEDIRDLTAAQREKLKKLAGVRYNPETDIVKMSCEMFESQAQNKRYLGDLVDNLLKEAKDPSDTFEDIPLDTRHHHFKQKPQFPREWALTEERQAELEEYRKNSALLDQQREPVDGVRQIEAAFVKPEPEKETLPGLDESLPVGRGRGRTVAVRR